jgi:L-lactate dehydrogenase complex protein LldE
MPDRRVTVFATCVVETLRPRVADATLHVLRRAGFTADLAAGATCCGQPAANAGVIAAARRVARHTMRRLARDTSPIVVPSGSCTTMIRHHWPHLFAGTRDEATARAVAGRTHELTEFLAANATESAARRDPRGAVVYHASCHLTRELDVVTPPRDVLRAAGYEVESLDDHDRCCGFGGTFSVTHADVSVAMADDKLDGASACGAATVTSCDLSCLVHLEARAARRRLPVTFPHVAELLQ